MNHSKIHNRNTALVIFSRSIEEELRYKPFLAKKSLVRVLYKNTAIIAKKSTLPVIFYDESKQNGSDFGTRFSNALEHIFNSGYENVIAIGNDCPQLKVEHILKAKKALYNNNTVIGGTYDGGFYLLGISKENFDKNIFLAFNWEKKSLFNEVFHSLCSTSSKCKVLQKLKDIDFYSDLENLPLNAIRSEVLRNCISSIVRQNLQIDLCQNLKDLLLTTQIVLNRGSPQVFLS